ncbi:MAG: MFS transporter [Trueperella sp.]|nr:MFS transporter [Trueperella sp.]
MRRNQPHSNGGSQTTSGVSAFWVLTLGQAVAAAGETATLTALTLALQLDGGTAWVTALIVGSFLPAVVLARPVSSLFDRFPALSVLQYSLVVRIFGTAAVAFSITAGHMVFALCLFVITRAAIVGENPAVLAVAPRLASPAADTQIVYARLAASRNLGAIAGPIIAGALIATLPFWTVLVFDAAAALAMVAAVVFVRCSVSTDFTRSKPSVETSRRTSLVVDLLLRSRAAPYVFVLALAILFTSILPVAQSAFFIDERGLSATEFGLIVGAYACGRLVAAAIGSIVTWPHRASTALALATISMGVGLATSTAPTPLPVVLLCFVIAGYANTLQVLSIRTLIHDSTAPDRIPQTFTALGAINNTATLIGTIGGGLLIGAVTGGSALLIAGTATAIIGLLGLTSWLRK